MSSPRVQIDLTEQGDKVRPIMCSNENIDV